MRNIIIVGAGSHAAELTEYIAYFNSIRPKNEQITIIGYLDDRIVKDFDIFFRAPFLGQIKEHLVHSNCEYLIAIGSVEAKVEVVNLLKVLGARLGGFIHPTALIASTAKIHCTTIISHNASVGPGVVIGAHNLINSRTTIGHNSKIGDGNIISPHVAISGNNSIGSYNLFGVNSATMPGIGIGDHNKIGAGTTVIDDLGSWTTVVGIKPKIIEHK